MNTSTEEIATFVSGLDANSLPDRLVEVTSQHVLEVIAGFFAGSTTPEAVQINGILGHDEGSRTGAIAMLSHAAESDPIHAETTICAGLIAIPPALMFARDGETAIAAIIAGYETSIRIGEALGSSRLLGQGWWPTAVVGAAGSAAATARALNLDTIKTRNAIALGLLHSGGLGTGAPEAPESRNLLAANCIRLGVEAAFAAKQGVGGAREPLTGDRGFLFAFGGEPEPDRLLAGLGDTWKIRETSLKQYPCALQAQTALAAIDRVLSENNIPQSGISDIAIHLPAAMLRIVGRSEPPSSHFAAAANLRFLAAALIRDRKLTPARMSDDGRDDPHLSTLMELIKLEHDPALDPLYPQAWPARVQLAASENVFEATAELPPGHPSNPLDISVSVERFRTFSANTLSHDQQNTLIDQVLDLSDLRDLTPLRELIARSF